MIWIGLGSAAAAALAWGRWMRRPHPVLDHPSVARFLDATEQRATVPPDDVDALREADWYVSGAWDAIPPALRATHEPTILAAAARCLRQGERRRG